MLPLEKKRNQNLLTLKFAKKKLFLEKKKNQ